MAAHSNDRPAATVLDGPATFGFARAPSALLDSPELHRRAAGYLAVVLGLDMAAWQSARTARQAPGQLALRVLAGDLRLVGCSLGRLVRLNPREEDARSEAVLRRWAAAWFVATAAPHLPAPDDDQWRLAAAAGLVAELVELAGQQLNRLDEPVRTAVYRAAVLRLTSSAAADEALAISPGWRVEVFRHRPPARGARRVFTAALDVVDLDHDADGFAPVVAWLELVVNSSIEELEPADDQAHRVAALWKVLGLGRLGLGDLVQVSSPDGRRERRRGAVGTARWSLVDRCDGPPVVRAHRPRPTSAASAAPPRRPR